MKMGLTAPPHVVLNVIFFRYHDVFYLETIMVS